MQHFPSLQDLKKEICKKDYKRKQIYIIWLALNFVQNNPEHFLDIGLGWLDNEHFLFNSTLFGIFANRKINTINHYFESYAFGHRKMDYVIKEKACEIYSIDNIQDQKCWCVRWWNGFTKSTTEVEVQNLMDFKSPRKSKKPRAPKNKIYQNEFDNLISTENEINNWINFKPINSSSNSEKSYPSPITNSLNSGFKITEEKEDETPNKPEKSAQICSSADNNIEDNAEFTFTITEEKKDETLNIQESAFTFNLLSSNDYDQLDSDEFYNFDEQMLLSESYFK